MGTDNLNNTKIEFSSLSYEGWAKNALMLASAFILAAYPLFMVVRFIISGNEIHSYFALLVLVAAEALMLKILFYVITVIFIHTKPFEVTKEAMVFSYFGKKETIALREIIEIKLNSTVKLQSILGSQSREAIVFHLKDGSSAYVLKIKSYKNIDAFVVFLERKFAAIIIDRN